MLRHSNKALSSLDGVRESEGRNIHTSYRWFGGDAARAKAYAKEIVGLQPDLIIASGTVALSAVQHTTKTTPIIFLLVGDPVGQGFLVAQPYPMKRRGAGEHCGKG